MVTEHIDSIIIRCRAESLGCRDSVADEQATSVLADAAPSTADPDPEVWFEVSPNTGRVHLHAAADGAAPLGLSIPFRALLARNDPQPVLEELVRAVTSRQTTP